MTAPAALWRIAVAGSLSAALALAQFVVPIAGALLSVFAPLPLLWLVRGAGGEGPAWALWPAGAAAVLAAGLPAVVGGRDLALGLLIQLGPLTAVLGVGLRRGWSLGAAVGAAAGAAMAAGLVALLVRSGLDLVAAGRAVVAQVEAAVASAVAQTAGDAVDPKPVAALFVRLLPGVALVGTVAVAWLNLFALRWWAGRKPQEARAAGREEEGRAAPPQEGAAGPPAGGRAAPETGGRPPLDDWSRWSAPEPLVFVLIVGGSALLLGVKAATTVGLNLLVVVGFVYFMQGLAIVGFFFRTREIPIALRVAGYMLIVAQQLLAVVVAAVGLADLWVDFRRRATRTASGAAPHDSENGGN